MVCSVHRTYGELLWSEAGHQQEWYVSTLFRIDFGLYVSVVLMGWANLVEIVWLGINGMLELEYINILFLERISQICFHVCHANVFTTTS